MNSYRIINGDASESAILRSMEMHLGSAEKYQEQRKKIFEVPFNSSNKWQLSVHDLKDSKDRRYLMVMKVGLCMNYQKIFVTRFFFVLMIKCIIKGAPERIIDLCTKIRVGDTVHELDTSWKKTFNDVYEELGGMGERVIGKKNYPK